jgi:hypothetical protein
MAELLGLSGVGGTLCPRCRESGSGALVGVGTPVLVGGRGRVLSGSGCVLVLYGPPYGYWWLRNYGGGGSWRGVLPTVGRVGEQKVNIPVLFFGEYMLFLVQESLHWRWAISPTRKGYPDE